MDEKDEPRWLRVFGWVASALLFAFLAWFLLVLVFGKGGPCLYPGGC